jgi:hypothetical protein
MKSLESFESGNLNIESADDDAESYYDDAESMGNS